MGLLIGSGEGISDGMNPPLHEQVDALKKRLEKLAAQSPSPKHLYSEQTVHDLSTMSLVLDLSFPPEPTKVSSAPNPEAVAGELHRRKMILERISGPLSRLDNNGVFSADKRFPDDMKQLVRDYIREEIWR
jgi:hypothetical protein